MLGSVAMRELMTHPNVTTYMGGLDESFDEDVLRALSGQLSARDNVGMTTRRSRYLRHRFPPDIISHAVRVYHRYCLSGASAINCWRPVPNPPTC